MSEHSPAPWHLTNASTQVRDANGSQLAEVKNFSGSTRALRTYFQINENARVIVAAPDLLAVAKMGKKLIELGSIVPGLGCESRLQEFEEAIDAAIARAQQ